MVILKLILINFTLIYCGNEILGRNPYCIDKNYAGVLIIWDRMFGTFAPERKSEELAYGLVHPVETFDPLTLQLFNYEYVIKRFLKAPLCEKFSVLFKGPGNS